ncbi:MAG: hypothetical protein ABIS45_18805, partial [Burkholderiales bacterium]
MATATPAALPPAIEKALEDLSALSFVAHRDVIDTLPALRHHGDDVALEWLAAVKRLVQHDREAAKAFVRGSCEAEKISETVLPWTAQALEFLQWPGPAVAVEGFMKNLPRAFGTLGHAGERRWAEIGFMWYARHSDSGRAYFTMPVLDLACRQGITGVEQLCEPLDELFETRKLMLATYLGGAIRVRNLLGAQAILPWALRGADILQSGRARGEAYFRLESEESLSVLLDHLPGFRMNERNRLLTLLLSVWYERPFELKESTWSPDKGRPFVETDGRSVFVPAVMPDRDEAILAVLHAAGRLLFGSFDRAALAQIFREVGAELPKSGQVAWAPLFARYGDDVPRFQLIFDACEDLRVDVRVQQHVPNFLARLHATGVSHRLRPPEALPYYDFALAMVEGALALMRGEPSMLDPRVKPLLEPAATIADSFRIANELYRETTLSPVVDQEIYQGAYLPGRAPNAARSAHAQTEQDQPQQTQAGADGEKQQSEEGDQGENEDEQNAETGGEQTGEREKMVASDGQSAGSSKMSLQRTATQEQGGGSSDKGKPYPEWDYREGRYKRNWSWVQEKPLAESNLAEANRLMTQYALALKRLKKAIQAQKPTRLAPKVRQFDGDDIDLNAV